MTPVIEVQGLPQNKRRIIFIVAMLLFCITVPISVFYAIGYRFDFTGEVTSIKSVGGMYVRNDTPNTEMFINNEPVSDMRVFQKAAYIQNLEAGMHRIHIQGADVQTWVKELPVFAYFVTEVTSFNLPKIPQIRIITKWNDQVTGNGIVFDTATSTKFVFASTTNTLIFSTSTATTSYSANVEYTYIKTLFASSSELQEEIALAAKPEVIKAFSFDVPTTTAAIPLATTTKSWRNFTLFQKGEDIYMHWSGDTSRVPYYYCVNYENEEKTVSEYGQHVFSELVASVASSSDLLKRKGERICRDTIHIDRMQKKVVWFDYFPDSTDLVLMHLEDGLYVTEVDDRAWQNAQLLYPGTDIQVIQDGGRVFVHDGEYYLEVFTELLPQV